ncbi:hypothetical protein RRG08_050730 [Elysia crispata]|uniref:Uncharacterized protein n=1 Tax=Elysia crispata TaxID=231223 RepID=A0AAE0ZTC9_9GAST|nr:hypothetical protein RRG08_050730 [Elysia crispata]
MRWRSTQPVADEAERSVMHLCTHGFFLSPVKQVNRITSRQVLQALNQALYRSALFPTVNDYVTVLSRTDGSSEDR